jgi:predicted N-acetyltransferase YhbS
MLERAVGSAPDAPADLVSAQEMAEPLPVREGGGTTPHIVVSAMQAADLPDVARVDHAITGRLRDRFLRRRLAESLADATVRVSLTARRGGVVVGYVMARVDAGDIGRIEPAAVIDSVGVDPAFGGRGVGRALFAQLLDNLAALHVERVETVVAPGALALNAFLHRGRFAPGQRIAFVRTLQT